MPFKHLLVHVDSSPRAAERMDLAVDLARRGGARLAGLFAEGQTLGAGLVGRRSPDRMAAAAREARAAFDQRARAAELHTEWWPLEPGEDAVLFGQLPVCCRYADLAIFGQHEPEQARLPEAALEHALFDGGRPLLVVPYIGHFPSVGRNVLVGWNGSREAARALNDALPILAGAESVRLLAFQREARAEPGGLPPLDVIGHLAAHGIKAAYERVLVDPESLDAADAMLNRSFDAGCDLIVTGAHAQAGFPGPRAVASTRKLLATMTAPVFFSH
jgi:nucleotide-binding universal stress UspA family protein